MKTKLAKGLVLAAIFTAFIFGLVKVAEVAIPYQEKFENNITTFVEGLES